MATPQKAIEMPHTPLAKSYEPSDFESKIYQFWEENGCFRASDQNASGQKAFSMMIPPPNITGVLHMGHALTNSIQDILVRWRRMKGDNTLWMPGTDHAGIATQAQVEKAIAKEGKNALGHPLTRHDLGREEFVARTWKWKEDHGSQITQQLKRLGSSLDWSRERFTMDSGLSSAVREVFVRLYEEGLIYRGERIINWCPRCRTALSDLEVIPTERKGHFWHLIYKIVDEEGTPVQDQNDQPAQLVIATTRPETLLGDTAVAIHPEDAQEGQKYSFAQGRFAVLPLVGRLIPIITDTYVDREFGSGALKVTPAHDFNDYELGKTHRLAMISVMGKDGRISADGGAYSGLKFSEAREKIIQDLQAQGLLVKVEDHVHKVGLCQRCDHVAEPILSQQWFVKIEPLARPAIEAVESGAITFSPKSWEKTYFEWMYHIRDWCISRQLWWGHSIPAWYCNLCGEVTVAKKNPNECQHCHAPSSELKQDEDVLDTWFSSALWPFSTLGWPEKTLALKTFYPTSILETGFDIIFFWVARMIMMGIHFMNDVPFHKVYLHAMVRDEKGEKMSKSKGNVIDPLVVINQHGADPLRFTLAIMAGQGRDIKLSVDRVEGYRAFCNKLWNAVKFFLMQWQSPDIQTQLQESSQCLHEEGIEVWIIKNYQKLNLFHRWIISRLQELIQKVESGLEQFEINNSAQALYDFTWYEFCDWYIEVVKLSLKEKGPEQVEALYVLHYVLENLLRLLHPFIPFVTEELWQNLPWKKASTSEARKQAHLSEIYTLMLQSFPQQNKNLIDSYSVEKFTKLQKMVESLRNFRGENNISPKVEMSVKYIPGSLEAEGDVQLFEKELKALARLSDLQKIEKQQTGASQDTWDAVIPMAQLHLELRIHMKGLVNIEEETKRLHKEIDRVNSDLAYIKKKLSQETFLQKAPTELVEKERNKEKELSSKRIELNQALERLKKLGE